MCSLLTAPGSCEEGAVRLMDGIIQQEGRVEVCSNGVWGSVCDESWDTTDAHVICQQMGHPELGKKYNYVSVELVHITHHSIPQNLWLTTTPTLVMVVVPLSTPMFHVVDGSRRLQTALRLTTPHSPVLVGKQLEFSVVMVSATCYYFHHNNNYYLVLS